MSGVYVALYARRWTCREPTTCGVWLHCRLVNDGVLTPQADIQVPEIPMDLATAVKLKKVREGGLAVFRHSQHSKVASKRVGTGHSSLRLLTIVEKGAIEGPPGLGLAVLVAWAALALLAIPALPTGHHTCPSPCSAAAKSGASLL